MQFSNSENQNCSITEKITYNDPTSFIKFKYDGITGSNTGFHIYNNKTGEEDIEHVSLLNNCLSIGEDNETNTNNLNVKGGSMTINSTQTTKYPLDIKGYRKLHITFGGYRYNTGLLTGSTVNARGMHISLNLYNSLELGQGEVYSSSDRRFKKDFSLTDPITSLDIVNTIELYKYDYITSKTKDNIYGYIAQHVEKIIPNAVFTTSNTINGKVIDDFKILKKTTINVVHHDAIRELCSQYINLKHEQEDLVKQLDIIKKNL